MKNVTLIILCFNLFFLSCIKTQPNNIDEKLIGNWATDENENVKFIITKNKLQDFEHLYSYDYEVKNNQLIVKDSIYTVASYDIKLLTKDSLILKNQNGIVSSYYKR